MSWGFAAIAVAESRLDPGVWLACLCEVNSVVTVDVAGGAAPPWAGPPSNGTFLARGPVQRPQLKQADTFSKRWLNGDFRLSQRNINTFCHFNGKKNIF